MFDEANVKKLKDRYKGIHPLVFHRSLERANNLGELFDILETVPEYPMVWNEDIRRWEKTKDISQQGKFKLKK